MPAPSSSFTSMAMEFIHEGSLKGIFVLLITLHLLSFFLIAKAQFQVDSLIGDTACKIVNCGMGTCNGSADDQPPFYFNCECNPGWTKIKVGPLTLPPCMLPNCTIDLTCGSAAPPSPPPPPPSLVPPINLSDPCSFTWCGEGTCKFTSGGILPAPICLCNEGSFNLLNLTGLPCLKQCNLGVGCPNLGLGLSLSPPPPPPQAPVPSNGSRSKGEGPSYSKNDVKWVEGSIVMMVLSIGIQFIVY